MRTEAADPNAVGHAGTDARGIRERLSDAAFIQFNDRGFGATTVDDIADAAGVSRRTFFRYFKTKEDAIFPEHDRLRAAVAADLQRRSNEPALGAVCAAVALVLDDYARHRDASLLRFALTRTVSSLRDREITAVHRYQRLFVRHLRDHCPDLDTQTIEIMAATVVAAHNSVLRDWLLNGASTSPGPDLTTALTRVQALFATSLSPTQSKSIVAVFAVDAAITDIMTAIQSHTETPPPPIGKPSPRTTRRRR